MSPGKLVWGRASVAAVALICERPCAAQPRINLDEPPIVVTAQRRRELPEDVPLSLTAKSGEELERMQATDTPRLDKVVPSLVMMRTGAFTQPYLRGIGKRSTLGVENSVATYVDGIYLASPVSALLDLRGVERVEVLNGPQGTLFGRNATGGVIQIVTREPGPETSVEAEVGAGSYGHVRGDTYVAGGSDRFAGNLALSLSRNGGNGTNIFTGRRSQGRVGHSFAGRSKWVWRPSGSLKLTLAGDYQDLDHDFMQLPALGYPPIGQPRIQTFRDGDQDTPSRYRFRYGGVSVRADAEIGELNFMSLSALRRMHERNSVDLDMGPQPLVSAAVSAQQNQFSQEFQLQSSEPSKLQWVAGLYYLHIAERYDPTTFSFGGSYSAQLGGRTGQTLFSQGTASAYAAYAQATVPIADATQFTLGMRYTIEQRTVRANGERTFDNPPFVRPIPGLPLLSDEPFRNSDTFRKLTWRATLARHFSDTVMAYAGVSRGFQSGGWNLQTPQNPAFGPETLDDFQAGVKLRDRAQRFSLDASLFYYRYSDLQLSAITPIGNATINAASAKDYGFELQLEARLDRRTHASVGAQVLRARFNRFPNATCTDYSPDAAIPYAPLACDVTGNRLPFAPRFKFNAGASHEMPLDAAGTVVLSGNLAHNSGYFSEPDNVVREKAYATLDASAEWRPARGRLSARIWARNLTDAHYSNSLVTFPTTGVLQRPAPPRQFGLSIGYAL